jgi:hypothetical protein
LNWLNTADQKRDVGGQVTARFVNERLASSTSSGMVSGVRYLQIIYADSSDTLRV